MNYVFFIIFKFLSIVEAWSVAKRLFSLYVFVPNTRSCSKIQNTKISTIVGDYVGTKPFKR